MTIKKNLGFTPIHSARDCDDISSKSQKRFESDYENLGILGKGTIGTVYKCKGRLDGLI